MGTSVDTTRAAVTTADHIIGAFCENLFFRDPAFLALSNKNMPRTFGEGEERRLFLKRMNKCCKIFRRLGHSFVAF